MHQGTLVFGVAIIILTFAIRRLVETAVPSAKKKADENEDGITYATTFGRYWNQVILYVLPPTVGALLGCINIEYLHGSEGPAELGGRVFNGLFVGGVSAMIYKLLKKRGVDLNQVMRTTNPPA
jgi:hypothetical protein